VTDVVVRRAFLRDKRWRVDQAQLREIWHLATFQRTQRVQRLLHLGIIDKDAVQRLVFGGLPAGRRRNRCCRWGLRPIKQCR